MTGPAPQSRGLPRRLAGPFKAVLENAAHDDDGFTLHAATRAGALGLEGREALLRYVLRPPIAKERLETRPDGLVRITLKRAYSDGTVVVEMDPLSLLCRLATSVQHPRYHTVKYAGVLAPDGRGHRMWHHGGHGGHGAVNGFMVLTSVSSVPPW